MSVLVELVVAADFCILISWLPASSCLFLYSLFGIPVFSPFLMTYDQPVVGGWAGGCGLDGWGMCKWEMAEGQETQDGDGRGLADWIYYRQAGGKKAIKPGGLGGLGGGWDNYIVASRHCVGWCFVSFDSKGAAVHLCGW